MRRTWFLLVVVACGPGDVIVDDIAPSDGSVFFDSTTTKDGSVFGDASAFDAGIDATKFNGGGPFLCFGCICDGTLNMCVDNGGGGGMPIDSDASFGDASVCDNDAAPTACTQIPIGCLPKPTCECIQPFVSPCTCSVDPSGNGLDITCPPKP